MGLILTTNSPLNTYNVTLPWEGRKPRVNAESPADGVTVTTLSTKSRKPLTHAVVWQTEEKVWLSTWCASRGQADKALGFIKKSNHAMVKDSLLVLEAIVD